MKRLSVRVVKSRHKGKGKAITILYLCFAALFVYSALLTADDDAGWILGGPVNKGG
jgi:hypothetical protein